jgi:hypothetical protein
LDQKTILEAIVQGFQKSPEQRIVSLSIIGLMVILLSLLPLFYRLYQRLKQSGYWKKEHDRLIRKYNLTINEMDLIDNLSNFLIEPLHKNLILKNKNTFMRTLSLYEKQIGEPSPFAKDLMIKIFGERGDEFPKGFEKAHGIGRPVRLYTFDGNIYSGYLTAKKREVLTLAVIKVASTEKKNNLGRIFIQDYGGIIYYPISSISQMGENTWRIKIAEKSSKNKKPIILPDVLVHCHSEQEPFKTPMIIYSNGFCRIENVNGILKKGKAIKISLLKDSNKIYRGNALITGLSLNKKSATLKFGYVKV